MSAKAETVLSRIVALLRGVTALSSSTDRVRVGEPIYSEIGALVPCVYVTETRFVFQRDHTITDYDRALQLTCVAAIGADSTDPWERVKAAMGLLDDCIAALEADRGLGSGGTDIVHDTFVSDAELVAGDEFGLNALGFAMFSITANWHAASGEGV